MPDIILTSKNDAEVKKIDMLRIFNFRLKSIFDYAIR
jgi:hypothetical protein